MPNRMLRDWTQSDKVDQITAEGERFFTRLIMKADDYGCFWGDVRLLKANLFPLKLDKVREADISRWIAECVKAGLILFYQIEGKQYVQIVDFRQRLDKARAKFPLPNDSNEFPEVVNEFPAEVELELEKKKKGSGAVAPTTHASNPRFLKFQAFIQEQASDVGKMKEPFTEDQFTKLLSKFTVDTIQKLVKDMHNWKDLLKKRKSAYLTFLRFAELEKDRGGNQSHSTNGNELTTREKADKELLDAVDRL
jgi:hypothetical protein